MAKTYGIPTAQAHGTCIEQVLLCCAVRDPPYSYASATRHTEKDVNHATRRAEAIPTFKDNPVGKTRHAADRAHGTTCIDAAVESLLTIFID